MRDRSVATCRSMGQDPSLLQGNIDSAYFTLDKHNTVVCARTTTRGHSNCQAILRCTNKVLSVSAAAAGQAAVY